LGLEVLTSARESPRGLNKAWAGEGRRRRRRRRRKQCVREAALIPSWGDKRTAQKDTARKKAAQKR